MIRSIVRSKIVSRAGVVIVIYDSIRHIVCVSRVVRLVGSIASVARPAYADIKTGHPTDMNSRRVAPKAPIIRHSGIPTHSHELAPTRR